MSDLWIAGLGAVSPAGWGVDALSSAISSGNPIPTQPLNRPGWSHPLLTRRVPSPPLRPLFAAHPRLRRASAISHFTAAAALEAMGHSPFDPLPAPGQLGQVGLIFCTMTGSVNYTRRFYEETLQDPATASPVLFPETVYNAPASHLAALLGLTERVHTEVGDALCALHALRTAALWFDLGVVTHCLLVAAEEADWLTADGLHLRHPTGIAAEGAGALLLAPNPGPASLARLSLPFEVSALSPSPTQNSRPETSPGTDLRVDDRDRSVADLHSLPKTRVSPKAILGDAWAAGPLWQCIAAATALASGSAHRALVSATDSHQRTFRIDLAAPPDPPT